MLELGIALGGMAVGVLLGWVLKSFASKAALTAAGQVQASLEKELTETRAARNLAVEELRTESGLRAAAVAQAERVSTLEAELREKSLSIERLTALSSSLETRLQEERKAAAEKIDLVNQAQASLANAFKALSAEALDRNNKAFLDLAQSNLQKFQGEAKSDLEARQKAVDALVKPLQESLSKVDGKLGEIEKSRLQSYTALDEQLKGLVNTHIPNLHRETANLVKALRQPTVRGRWGEIQLQRVVEMAGMVEHCHFEKQESVSTEDGLFRPDLKVNLPGGKCVVVDAKAPVSAYLDAMETEDETARALLLADHARQVRTHITQLGRKAYWERLDQTPEFVILFLPGEMFFSAALQQDPGLIEFGVNEKVIPATPTTLIALLRAVSYGWRQEALAENAQAISDLGRELFKRIGDLAGHWSNVGKHLEKTLDSYNKATGSLESRVLVTARRFKDLKATPDGVDLEPLEILDRAPRELQAPEFTGREKVGSGE